MYIRESVSSQWLLVSSFVWIIHFSNVISNFGSLIFRIYTYVVYFQALMVANQTNLDVIIDDAFRKHGDATRKMIAEIVPTNKIANLALLVRYEIGKFNDVHLWSDC